MTRIDWLIVRRLAGGIALSFIILYGLLALVESLNTWRFTHLSAVGGPVLGILGIAGGAMAWSLITLPVSLLIGTIVGLLNLHASGEMTVIKAAGISTWRMLRAPLVFVVFGVGGLCLVADSATVVLLKALQVAVPDQSSQNRNLWLQQTGDGYNYIMLARHQLQGGAIMEEVTFFLPAELGFGLRIGTNKATLGDGVWHVDKALRFSPDSVVSEVSDIDIPTNATRSDLNARLASPGDSTFFELLRVANLKISDPRLRSGVLMRLFKLIALPLTLGAVLIIGFAFTAGYRRTNKYGTTVLYGIVLGFVVYLVMEMAASAGSSGVLQPALAAFGPAFVAMVVGTTVLLFREDGRR